MPKGFFSQILMWVMYSTWRYLGHIEEDAELSRMPALKDFQNTRKTHARATSWSCRQWLRICEITFLLSYAVISLRAIRNFSQACQ